MVYPAGDPSAARVAYVKKWLRLNGINLNKIPLDSEIWVQEIGGEQHVFFERFVEHHREYCPGKPGRVTFVMNEDDEIETETQQRRLTHPWVHTRTRAQAKGEEHPLCRCGHREDQHQDDTGLGGAQCLACPGDEERSWRHPYTPKEN